MLRIFDSELGDDESYDAAYIKYVRSRSKSTTTSMDQKVNRIGGVAQLGERLPCTQEVIGSIPFTSTNICVICDDV